MSWLNVQNLTWSDPLQIATSLRQVDMALFYSGLRDNFGGDDTYLFWEAQEVIEGTIWDDLPESSNEPENASLPDWVGYLGYGLRAPKMPLKETLPLPAMRWVRYRYLLRFNHRTQSLTVYSRDGSVPAFPNSSPNASITKPSVRSLQSNFIRHAYEAAVAATVERIHAGDFYQANITRKFFGELAQTPDDFAIFQALCAASPAPYSAFIRHQGLSILSSSPECFLRIDRDGGITTRPIKGSARRSSDAPQDQIIQDELRHSTKNRAENLMIVDLMRNDLAQVSVPESVTVTEQSGLYSYATIHHLISTVRAQKRPDAALRDVLKACFPPGSMTGAPKRAAMQWCDEVEQYERGVYSGALGWLGPDGSCDLSVVIRTLILKGSYFEFQVGGGIVADSLPEDEWRETLAKARGVLLALGLEENAIAAL